MGKMEKNNSLTKQSEKKKMTAYIVDQKRGLDHKRYEDFRKAQEMIFKGG